MIMELWGLNDEGTRISSCRSYSCHLMISMAKWTQVPTKAHAKGHVNVNSLLWSSIMSSTSCIISAYRRWASSAICCTLWLRVSNTPVGCEWITNGTASRPLIHSVYVSTSSSKEEAVYCLLRESLPMNWSRRWVLRASSLVSVCWILKHLHIYPKQQIPTNSNSDRHIMACFYNNGWIRGGSHSTRYRVVILSLK
jgi:hypothetical protein